MIQRKQSLWLLIAALLNAGVFLFDQYKYSFNKTVLKSLPGVQTPVSIPETKTLHVSNDIVSLAMALVMILLPLVTIFLFKNRKQQILMVFACMLAVVAFIGMVLMRVHGIDQATLVADSESYRIGAVLPMVSLLFLILAIIGIRRDDKLVKSADRLR